MSTFPDVKKNFGFGCMRLPMDGEKVDYAEFTKMVDEFMAQGFNYFDTARVYIGGQGETAIRDCVVKRYPRDSFILTDKLSDSLFNSEDEIRPLFEKQLESCGVDYFDFYLLHSQTKSIFEKYKKLHAYEHAFELKKEGKVKHVGFSFHDTADVLDEMLNEYPEIEVVQIQLNYIDFEDPAVQARLHFAVRKSAFVGVHCFFVLQYSARIEIIIPIEFSQHEPVGLSKNFFIHLHFSCSCGRVLLSPKTTRR